MCMIFLFLTLIIFNVVNTYFNPMTRVFSIFLKEVTLKWQTWTECCDEAAWLSEKWKIKPWCCFCQYRCLSLVFHLPFWLENDEWRFTPRFKVKQASLLSSTHSVTMNPHSGAHQCLPQSLICGSTRNTPHHVHTDNSSIYFCASLALAIKESGWTFDQKLNPCRKEGSPKVASQR